MNILYFAWIREKIGKGSETLDLPDGVATVSALADWLAAKGGGYGEAFADRALVRVAVNQVHVRGDAPVSKDDEVAFFPPVTGGRGSPRS